MIEHWWRLLFLISKRHEKMLKVQYFLEAVMSHMHVCSFSIWNWSVRLSLKHPYCPPRRILSENSKNNYKLFMFSWSYKRTIGWKCVSGIPSLQVPHPRKEVSQILTWFPRLPRWDRKNLRESFISLCLIVPSSPWKQLSQFLTSWNTLQGFDSPREDLDTIFLVWKHLTSPSEWTNYISFSYAIAWVLRIWQEGLSGWLVVSQIFQVWKDPYP